MSAILKGVAMAAPDLLNAWNKFKNKAPQKKTSSDTTNYLNKLRQVSSEGLYGQNVKNEVGADIKQGGDRVDQNIRNLAVQQGIENSGVLADQLLKSGGQTTLQMARMAKQIAQLNEQSKLDASAKASSVGSSIENTRYQNALLDRSRKDDGWNSISNLVSKFSGKGGVSDDDFEKFLNTLTSGDGPLLEG